MVETARTPEPTAVGQACRAAVRRAEGLCEPCLAQCRIAWRSDGNSTRLGGLVESWQNRPQCASSSPCGGISATRKGCAIGGLGLDAEGGPKLDADHHARMAVQVAECYADGLPTGHDIIRTYCDTNALLFPLGRRYTPWVPAEVLDAAYTAVLRTVSQSGCYYGQKWEYREYDACQCAGDAVARVTRVVASPDQVVT